MWQKNGKPLRKAFARTMITRHFHIITGFNYFILFLICALMALVYRPIQTLNRRQLSCLSMFKDIKSDFISLTCMFWCNLVYLLNTPYEKCYYCHHFNDKSRINNKCGSFKLPPYITATPKSLHRRSFVSEVK